MNIEYLQEFGHIQIQDEKGPRIINREYQPSEGGVEKARDYSGELPFVRAICDVMLEQEIVPEGKKLSFNLDDAVVKIDGQLITPDNYLDEVGPVLSFCKVIFEYKSDPAKEEPNVVTIYRSTQIDGEN